MSWGWRYRCAISHPERASEQDRAPDVLSHYRELAWSPLVSREAVVNLIGNTTTKGGLEIQAELDEGSY